MDDGQEKRVVIPRESVTNSDDIGHNKCSNNVEEEKYQLHSKTKWSPSSITVGQLRLSHAEHSVDMICLCENDSPRSVPFTDRQDTVNAGESIKNDTKSKFSLSREDIVILASVGFSNLLSYFSLSSLAPFFPLEADKKGVNRTISGWIFAVVALVKFLTFPLLGKLVPIAGTRFVLLSGLFLCGGCSLCFGFLDRIDTRHGNLVFIIMCFLTRILLGLGCVAIGNASLVILAKQFPDNVTTVFAIHQTFLSVGMVTGPAVGGFLYDTGGFLLPFAVGGAFCFLVLSVIWLSLKPQTCAENIQESEESGNYSLWKVACQPKSIVNSITVTVAAANWSVFDPILEPHLRVFGVGPSVVGLFFLLMAACFCLSAPVWGWIADKLSDNRSLLVTGFLFVALGFLIIGPSPILGIHMNNNSLWLPIIAVIILSLSGCMTIIPSYGVYIDVLSDIGYHENTWTYGIVYGLWGSVYSFGDFAGPSLGGFLSEEIGFEWLTTWFAVSSVLTCMAVIISWYLETTCRKLRGTKKGEKSTLLPMQMSKIKALQ